MMMLVTGANGMVGSYVQEIFKEHKILSTDIENLDVSNKEDVFDMVSKYKPAFILHLAAETDVDKCELEPEHAFKINAKGTENIANACKEYNAVLIYVSTGAVFNGKKDCVYTENDKPSPLNIYSKSKYEGEQIVQSVLNRYYIFRAGWMIGGGPEKDKKFVGKIIELSKTRNEIRVVNDKFGSPTYAWDFLRGVKELIKRDEFGLYHLVNKGVASRLEIANEVITLINPEVKILPVSSDVFPLPAPRPDSEALKNSKLENMGLDLMPHWKESMQDYVNKWIQRV